MSVRMRMLDERSFMNCSRCLDVVLYCSCEREDPSWSKRKQWADNPSYWIYLGGLSAEWDRQGRALFGDEELIEQIRNLLSGQLETVLHLGFQLWMVEQDPYAVHHAAQQITGATFSESAPVWSDFSQNDFGD